MMKLLGYVVLIMLAMVLIIGFFQVALISCIQPVQPQPTFRLVTESVQGMEGLPTRIQLATAYKDSLWIPVKFENKPELGHNDRFTFTWQQASVREDLEFWVARSDSEAAEMGLQGWETFLIILNHEHPWQADWYGMKRVRK